MKLPLAFLLLTLAPAMAAQTITTTPTAPTDSLPNNPAVPDVVTSSGQFERVVVLRMKFGTDMLAGIQKGVAQENIRNGVILAGIGSVRGYRVHQVYNRNLPTQNIFTSEPDTPADLDGVTGYVIDGKVHAHITLATGDKAIAGHLESGTEVFTYAIVTIGVLKGADLSRAEDKGYR